MTADIERMAGLPPLPEPHLWTTAIEIAWAQKNIGRAGSLYSTPGGPSDVAIYTAEDVREFAALVRADALEDAAKVCDQRAKEIGQPLNLAYQCAAAIRALATQATAAQFPQAAP